MSVVLEYIRKHKSVQSLSLNELNHSLAFLLCLSGQRCQTIYNYKLSLDNMSIVDSKITFVISENLKHTRAGTHQDRWNF